MEILKILAVLVTVLILIVLLKQQHPVYGVLLSAFTCIAVLLYITQTFVPLLLELEQKLSLPALGNFEPVLKAVGIGLATEVVQDMCAVAGESALAAKAVLAGKLAILACALPLLTTVIDILTGLLR